MKTTAMKTPNTNRLIELCRKHKGGIAHFTNDPQIDAVINNIVSYPHMFVLACLMDRQIKAERAWEIPYLVGRDLNKGDFSFKAFNKLTLDELTEYFNRNTLHRYNDQMAKIFHQATQRIANDYSGNAGLIWEGEISSAEVIYRFLCFEGCGIKIASMAANLLHRIFKKQYTDYSALDISPDIHIRRVMHRLGLVDNMDEVDLVVYKARSIHPQYPGILDECLWDVGRQYCHPSDPDCKGCELAEICMKNITETTKK